jgi:hypothetical protein
MNGAFRGSQKFPTRFLAIRNPFLALSGLLVLFANTGFGQVILDDFSTDNQSKYNFVQVFGGPANGWSVSDGELHPSITGIASATWLWNQGEKLAATGDSVSISLSLPTGLDNGFPNSVGLFVTDPALTSSHFVALTLDTANGIWGYSVDGLTTQAASAPSGPVQATIQRTGEQSVDGFRYAVTFSGGGLPSPVADSFFTENSDSLLFGPYAENTTGTGAAADNFTFTAVPEPSMYAAVFGLLALMTGVVRTRMTRRP